MPIARARHGSGDEIVVAGDTPNDVACARAGAARCVAVTSGPHGPEALAAADAVVTGIAAAADVIRDWARDAAAQSPTARAAAS